MDGRFIFTGVQPGNLKAENDDSEKAIRVEKGQLTTAILLGQPSQWGRLTAVSARD